MAGTKQTGGGSAVQKFAKMQASVAVSRAGQESKVVSYLVVADRMLVFPLVAPGGIAMVASPAFSEFVKKIVMIISHIFLMKIKKE